MMVENLYGEVGDIVEEVPGECIIVDFPNLGFTVGWPPRHVVTVIR